MRLLRLFFGTLALLIALSVPTGISAQSDDAIQFRLDANNSDLTARVRFFGIASKTARFPRIDGTVKIVPRAPDRAEIDVRIDARTIEAPDETTLRRLRSEKFFWVERHPTIRFTGKSLRMITATRGSVTGELTARGVTRAETLNVQFESDPTARRGLPVTFTGEMRINRRNYGMRSYSLIVGDTVRIKLRARMVPT